MLRKILMIAALLICVSVADAEVKFGVRGGLNVTEMSFTRDLLNASNRAGFYLGPTIKIDLPLGVDIDAALLYNQFEAVSDLYITEPNGKYSDDEQFPSLKRKTLALPINVRKGFGFGDRLDVFVFGGPQFDFNISGDLAKSYTTWSWRTSALSINLGAGMMMMEHFEVRINYNIACGSSGEFEFDYAKNNVVDGIKAKTGGWQIGMAYYF